MKYALWVVPVVAAAGLAVVGLAYVPFERIGWQPLKPVPPPVPQKMESEGTAKPEQSDTQAGRINSYVSNRLNAADVMFKQGMDGCPGVARAIEAANDSSTFGPTTCSGQIKELKKYAKRCNLRF
jgi:hypothetical protein